MSVNTAIFRTALIGLFSAAVVGTVVAETTRVDIKVSSRGANFLGASTGGAQVTLRDLDTGVLLASGSTADGGIYRAEFELDAPVYVELAARGPMANRESAGTVTATQWLLPGRELTGDAAWVIEMPGFIVDLATPALKTAVGPAPAIVEVEAYVAPMCGCPVEPGGRWDADGYEVVARLLRNGETVAETPLAYTGEISHFAGELTAGDSGTYEILVYAFDPANGNTGIDRTTIVVE